MTTIAGAAVWGRALKSKCLRVELSVAAVVVLLNAVATVAAHAAEELVTDRPPLPLIWWVAPVGSVVALIFAYVFFRSVMSKDEGTPEMIEIAQAVREGAMAYLKRQYRVVGIIFAVLFVVFLGMAFGLGAQNTVVPFAFLTGGLFSGICGFFGMKTATYASARTTHAARTSLNGGLQVAFRAGAVMGLVVVGFALLDITGWFLGLYYLFPPSFFGGNPLPQITVIMLSFGMGASTQALFARVGGGIYTKAADVGADIVGKVEVGLPEDDPRNAATIADNVGDNVGDVAGMGADLYESYAGSILATAALGVAAVSVQARKNPGFLGGLTEMEMQLKYLAAPMVLAGIGIFLSILGVYMVRAKEDAKMRDLLNALSRSINFSSIAIALAALGVLHLLGIPQMWHVWGAIVVGLLAGIIIGKATEYYTSQEYKPTQKLAEQTLTGAGTTIIDGIALGMMSTAIPVVTIVTAIILSYYLPGGANSPLLGLYGIGIAAVGMLSTLGLTLATDAYGPIADNAGGNAEMAGLPPEVRQRTDQLDALGNTTAATGKGFAIGSAALTAMALLAAYIEEIRYGLMHLADVSMLDIKTFTGEMVHIPIVEASIDDFMAYYDVTLMNPNVLVGLFLGSVMSFFFCALTMKAVGRAAGAMVDEVRRQIREIPGIMEGTTKPDYARCVEISTVSAQREMVLPSLLAIAAPIVVGILFSVSGVLGLLAGGLATGFVLAVMMANAGGAWDNAKKYIEEGHHGGKGSDAHKAAIVGDTVGDPFKDTSGPSLNILIKLMAMVSIVFAGFIAKYAGQAGIVRDLLGG
jgi:K(+)-stimulated pyrophosphate-energized sodium pump